MQKWEKLGLIFEPYHIKWADSHAAIPFAELMSDYCRIYFNARNEAQKAQIGFFDINLNNPRDILSVSEAPILSFGSLGTFDDRGVTTGWIISKGKLRYQYYSGWHLGGSVPFYFFVGLAISEDDGHTYQRYSRAPILDRNAVDPFLTASPCILIEDGIWRMWYVSGKEWRIVNRIPRHYYHIKYAESQNGINWKRDGKVCIDFNCKSEYAIARPCVIKENGIYRMWYCFRGQNYKIGYAESSNGIDWVRKDSEIRYEPTISDWDNEMQCYPYVFNYRGTKYLLYNGNEYGKTGIGLAVLKPGE
jgi:hypothetical protein